VGANVFSYFFFQSSSPLATSMPNRSSEIPATIAISRAPRAVVTRSAISGEKRLCISRGWLSSLTFHSSFMSLTLAGVKTFSSLIQPVRPGSLPSVR
jgi:hypothetical protein